MKRHTFTIPEVARMFGLSKNSAYAAARSGQIPTIRIGDRYIVPRSALEKLLGEKLDDSHDGQGAA